MRIPIPPPPPPPPPVNKNKLWCRYSKGEILKATYDPIQIKSKIPPPPPEPQQPRIINYGKDQLFNIDAIFLGLIAIGLIAALIFELNTFLT